MFELTNIKNLIAILKNNIKCLMTFEALIKDVWKMGSYPLYHLSESY